MGSDRTLGMIEVLTADYIQQADNGEYLVHDTKTAHAGVLRVHGKGSPKGTLNYTASFFPCLNIADPEDEEEAATKKSSERGRISVESGASSSSSSSDEKAGKASLDPALAEKLEEGEKEQDETTEEQKLPKIHLTPEQLLKYESGLIIFKILDVELSEKDVHVEVVVDDLVFPSFTSSRIKSKKSTLDEIGDCFVRELDFSKITLRIREKGEHKGDDKEDHIVAKLTGNTLETLKQCLVRVSSIY